jgi:hypothetical protein
MPLQYVSTCSQYCKHPSLLHYSLSERPVVEYPAYCSGSTPTSSSFGLQTAFVVGDYRLAENWISHGCFRAALVTDHVAASANCAKSKVARL